MNDPIHLFDALRQLLQLQLELSPQHTERIGQIQLRVFQNTREQRIHMTPALGQCESTFQKKAANRVHHRRAAHYPTFAHAMQGLQIQLPLGLDRHKAHPGPLHRFRNGFRIQEVTLVGLHVRLHVLRRHQSHFMTLPTEDATDDVRTLLATFTLDGLFQPAFWKQLNFYARIVPDGDILPVRSVYDSKSGTCNIGLNALNWKQPMWIAGPDLIASVLLTGYFPNVREAFRIVPHRKQRGLRPVKLRGAILVDPRKEDFFTRVIEYRKQNKHDDRLQYFLKILANSTSYGTYLELNPVKIDASSRPKITVHSGEHIFEQLAPDTIEEPGRFYFPLLGALITSGGRLLLAMIERCVRDAGGTYLCCDTDALIIVASESGGAVQTPDGASPVKALSWSEVEQIRSRFDSLSPYNPKIVPHLLRLTDENYDKNGAQRQLFGLSIAAKRYVLYTMKCGQPYCGHRKCVTIVDPKAHGLIFCAPSEERENGLPKWWWELWRFLLTLEFKQIIEPDSNVLMVAGRAINAETGTDVDGQPSWIGLPALMKMRISTPHCLDQMKGKASPFGFVLHPRTRDKLKLTLLTPFSKNRAGWAQSPCISTHDGKSYRLDDLSPADIITLGDILCGYVH